MEITIETDFVFRKRHHFTNFEWSLARAGAFDIVGKKHLEIWAEARRFSYVVNFKDFSALLALAEAKK